MGNNITPVILTAMDLKVHFGEQVILNNASLSIHEGDRIGLVGRNGAGKSTFLKIISEVMEPDSGNRSGAHGTRALDYTHPEVEGLQIQAGSWYGMLRCRLFGWIEPAHPFFYDQGKEA